VSKEPKISERVSKLRESRGWSQEQLAKAMGFSRNYVSMIEGGREPGKSFIEALRQLEGETGESGGPAGSGVFRPASGVPALQILGSHTRKSEQMHSRRAPSTAREKLADLLTARALSIAQFAKAIGYDAGVVDHIVNGTGRASEKMIEAIVRAFPQVSKEELMEGSDQPSILAELGMEATYGAKPSLALPLGVKGRYVPLLSMAQAGAWDAGHSDEGYAHEGVFALNVDDRRAFAIRVAGNSMEPEIREGDVVICSPTMELHNGECAVVRTHSGQAFIKFWRRKGDEVVLESANPAYKPIHLPVAEIAGAWPVVQRIASGQIRRKREG
jgi:SOS-response transcriptional repressor LexA